MKMTDVRNMNVDELDEKLSHFKKELMQYRFQAKTGKLERQSAVTETKQTIARILTVMNELKRKEEKK